MARTNSLGNFLTDVADAIREKKGTTDTILASNFDTEIASIEGGVDINEYLSDTITNGSNSLGGWAKTIKKMRSPLTIEGTSAEYMFYNCPVNELPQLDTSNVTNMSHMFTICANLTTIPQINTSNVTNMSHMFSGCRKITTIPQLNGEKLINVYSNFHNCTSLENFNGLINLGQEFSTSQNANYYNYTLDLSSSTSLTEQSIINILNNLYDIATKGCKTQTVTLGATNLAKLTSTEGQQALASAQSKGWNVA